MLNVGKIADKFSRVSFKIVLRCPMIATKFSDTHLKSVSEKSEQNFQTWLRKYYLKINKLIQSSDAGVFIYLFIYLFIYFKSTPAKKLVFELNNRFVFHRT